MEDENGRFSWPRVKATCRFKRPLGFEEEVEIKLIVTEMRDRSITYAFQFWKEESGERVKAAVGEAVAACVRFDQTSGSMSPIRIPVFTSRLPKKRTDLSGLRKSICLIYPNR